MFGDRGTGKSTAVRALAALLPPMQVVAGCRYGCDPGPGAARCEDCLARGEPLPPQASPVPVVDLPLGATEDRVVGALDLERALTDGFTTGGGLGLGLSGARRLSNEFDIRSVVGEGTRVVIARWR